MCSKIYLPLLAGALIVSAQSGQKLVPKIDLPAGGPLSMLSADWGESSATPRGGAYDVDVRASLSFKNLSQQRIRAVTLAVLAQEATPGGKGSVSVPSLDVAPGETFPININMHLLRPIGGAEASVQVRLDGVLFDDLTFFGPDKLNSRRTMTVWELEARRDRQYFKKVLETAGNKGLQDAMIESLTRQSDPPPGGVQVIRGRVTNVDPERELAYAFLHFPDAPVQASGGIVSIAENKMHAPRVAVTNRSNRPINYVEIGWIVKDQDGREYLGLSMPADVSLAPGRTGQIDENASMAFTKRISIRGMTGFLSSVGFADGSYWIPDRATLADQQLHHVLAPSPEEQRLAQLYQKRGLNRLIEELKKF